MASRQQRYRQRKAGGIIIVQIGLDEAARLDLVDDGYLDWDSMDDRAACARAVVELVRVTRNE